MADKVGCIHGADWIAWIGVMPYLTMKANCWALIPCGQTPASVPKVILASARTAFVNFGAVLRLIPHRARENQPACSDPIGCIPRRKCPCQIGAMLFGKRNPFIIDKRGVFDRCDSGANRILYAFGCVRASTRRPKLAASSTAAVISSGVVVQHATLNRHQRGGIVAVLGI